MFYYLGVANEVFWSYIGFSTICVIGVYLTIKSRFLQLKTLFNFRSILQDLISKENHKEKGLHPIKLYFTSLGGTVGIGNIVAVGAAVFIGGPGAIFWMWVASLFGMLIKYSEIYLGVKYRVENRQGGYSGGPMFFLQRALKNKTLAYLSAIFLCIYGIEVYQFVVIVDRIQSTFALDRSLIVAVMIIFILYTVIGGLNRMANICSVMMPVFMIGYLLICAWVIADHILLIPSLMIEIVSSAFCGSSAIGGFVGSSMLMAAYSGTSRAVYSSDIGVGFDSIVQSETMVACPKKQAQISIFVLFTETLMCTLTSLVVASTGSWHNMTEFASSDVMAEIFKRYIPYSDIFITILIFLAGITTIIAYIFVGLKAADFIANTPGKLIYMPCAVFALAFFSYFPQEKVILVMQFTSGFLVLINLYAIFRLREKIEF